MPWRIKAFAGFAGVAASLSVFLLVFPALSTRRPTLSAHNIVNAADYRGGGVAPGEIVVLFPSHAGPPELAEWPTIFPRSAEDLLYLRRQPGWGTISGTRVFFDNITAPVVYSVKGQVEAIVPFEVSGRKATEVTIEYRGARSRPVRLPVVASAPALFTLNASGKGQAAMLNETGCCNSARNPATRGAIASLYATGEGRLPGPVEVTVGSVPAEVVYAGNVGMLVVNFRVPLDAPTGDAIPLVLTVGGARSGNGATMAIRSSAREVLVIDKDPAAGRRLTEILQQAGFGVLQARDWSEAAAQAQNHSVDLTIAELAIAEEGVETINAIRKAHSLVKVIVLSGNAGPSVLRAADLLGANAVLQSRVTREILLKRVRGLLWEPPARY